MYGLFYLTSLALEDKFRQILDKAKPLYILPKDPVVDEVLNPALAFSEECKCMIGYFSSKSFSQIAFGLAEFLSKNDAPLKLVVSPYLTDQDLNALTKEEIINSRLLERIFLDSLALEDALSRHTLECLAWLIHENRLIIKVAFMKNALMHTKAWIFKKGIDEAALHGSMNFTSKAMLQNREQLTFSRSWKGGESIYHIDRLSEEFDELWFENDKDCVVVELKDAIKKKIVQKYKGDVAPNKKQIEMLWRTYNKNSSSSDEGFEKNDISIPEYINYESGDFKHQGDAIKAWIQNDYHGILEMATGSGKTITSLIATKKLLSEKKKLLVIISAPYKPLIEQWSEEVKLFGAKSVKLPEVGNASDRRKVLRESVKKLKYDLSNIEVLITSDNTLQTKEFIDSINSYKSNIPVLLIADECHNLGASEFILEHQKTFDFRLGLSATPIRQYDEEGTDILMQFFGGIIFKYTLDDAIGNCLTPYKYYVHLAELTEDELITYKQLSDKISELSWKFRDESDDPYLNSLLRKRRLILETSSSKPKILETLLRDQKRENLNYTLVYATDKDPDQLESINKLLSNLDIPFHQLTSSETSKAKIAHNILSEFQNGRLNVLTAKRVLDEGINVPEIKKAFILASTTVKRQWIQRRGRLLRTCKEINKEFAEIHDFVTVPPGIISGKEIDSDVRKLVRSELNRVWEFARLSMNRSEENGSYKAVEKLQKIANEL